MHAEESHSFGDWLRRRRKALDWTQAELARRVNCTAATIRKIEADERKPSHQLAELLFAQLQVPADQHTALLHAARYSVAPGNVSLDSPTTLVTRPPNNLPAPLTALIGREHDAARLRNYFLAHDKRLVTLIGPPGIGKTRLSLQVATDLLADFADGVFFVPLAAITDPNLVAPAIEQTLGLVRTDQRSDLERLKEGINGRQLLIVLDNFEQVIEAASLAPELLAACPRLKLIVTSRESLRVPGEWLYPVPPLTIPDETQSKRLSFEALMDFSALTLFAERARAVRAEFALTSENFRTVATICRQLDGLPLAIELIAARIRLMSPHALLARLTSDFTLRADGMRGVPPRQKTLHNAIAWSYDLLSQEEQRLFAALSVFSGGFTLEAAQAVTQVPNVLAGLTSLLDKSLLVRTLNADDEVRFNQLVMIRDFALDRLRERNEEAALRDRHLAYFVKQAQQAEPELYRSNQVWWLNRLDHEFDNLRMALEWALATDIEAGLRIAAIPWRFWQERGYLQELGDWLAQLLERYSPIDSLHVQALITYCECINDYVRVGSLAEQSLRMARTLSDQPAEALSLLMLGRAISLQGNLREGMPVMEQSLASFQALGDKLGQADAMLWLSWSHNDLERSKAYLRESLRLYRELGHLSRIADCLDLLARRTIFGGDFSSPIPWLEEACDLFHQLGNIISRGNVSSTYGLLHYWQGDLKQAQAHYQESLRLYEQVGDIRNAVWSQTQLAYIFVRQGDSVQAREMFGLAIQQFHKTNSAIGLVYAVEGLARMKVNQGQVERAAQLFTWADAMRETINDARPPMEQAEVDRDLAVIHAQLADVTFQAEHAAGRKLTLDKAIELALSECAIERSPAFE